MTEFLVEHDYKAQDKDELTIQKGDIITDCEFVEEGWMKGELRGKKGLFPDNFGKIVEKKKAAPEPSKEIRRGRVTQTYSAKSKDELNVSAGSHVHILAEFENTRQYRIRTSDGREGRVPRQCVDVLSSTTPSSAVAEGNGASEKPSVASTESEPTGGAATRPGKVMGVGFGDIFSGNKIQLRKGAVSDIKRSSMDVEAAAANNPAANNPPSNQAAPNKAGVAAPRFPGRTGGGKPVEQARALFAYSAENTDELTLEPGDIITLLSKDCEDEGWWRGELRGKVGVFPDNFVELIPSSAVEPPAVKGPAAGGHEGTASFGGVPAKAPPPVPQSKPGTLGTGHKLPTSASVDTPNALSSAGDQPGGESLQHVTKDRPLQPGKRKPTKPLSELGENPVPFAAADVRSREHLEVEDFSHQPSDTGLSSKKAPPPRPLAKPTANTLTPAAPSASLRHGDMSAPAAGHGEDVVVAVDKNHMHMVDNLRSEVATMKETFVSRREFEALQEDVEDLKVTYSNRVQTLMQELDEEKKQRLASQVELERIRRLVSELELKLSRRG